MRGKFANELGDKILEIISNEIELEFPITSGTDFEDFYEGRKYHKLKDKLWK